MATVTIPVGVAATVTVEQLWGAGYWAINATGTQVPPGMTRATYQITGTPTTPGSYVIKGLNEDYGNNPPDALIVVQVAAPPPVQHVRAPLGMRLDDRVTVKSGDGKTTYVELDAQVGHASTGVAASGVDMVTVQELRAIVPVWSGLDYTTQRVEWRGQVYAIDGAPMVARRHGRDHHLTLRLKKSSYGA